MSTTERRVSQGGTGLKSSYVVAGHDAIDPGMALVVEGKVERAQRFEFADLAALPGQVADVSESFAGRSGGAVRLASVLECVGVSRDATHITVESSDGSFAASVPLDAVADSALLCYRSGDDPLPTSKGGPVRMLIPAAAAAGNAAIDACANVKFVGLLTVSVGPGRDTRPASKRAHAQLHEKPGHEHLNEDEG
jgi:hypothetical protein